jgi:hypothetical protein
MMLGFDLGDKSVMLPIAEGSPYEAKENGSRGQVHGVDR